MSKYIYKGKEYSEYVFDLEGLLEAIVDNESEVTSTSCGQDYYADGIYIGNDYEDDLKDIIEKLSSYGIDIVKKED